MLNYIKILGKGAKSVMIKKMDIKFTLREAGE